MSGPEGLDEAVLGQRVKLARRDSGLTQKQLADAIGTDQPAISRFEAGKDVSSLLLSRIARATGKDVDFFLRPSAIANAEIFLRRGDAGEPDVVRAIDEMGRLVNDYESLERLPLDADG